MAADGSAGTYREPRRRYRVERITCTHCGLVRDVAAANGQDFVFWYKVTIGGEAVWASNRAELDALVAWLGDERRDARLDPATRATFEILPDWITQCRAEVIAGLLALRDT